MSHYRFSYAHRRRLRFGLSRVVAATLMLQIMMPSNTRSFSDVATSVTLSLDADVSSMRIMFNAG